MLETSDAHGTCLAVFIYFTVLFVELNGVSSGQYATQHG